MRWSRHAGARGRLTVLHVSQATETGLPHVVDGHLRAQLAAGWRVVVACPGGTLARMSAQSGAEVIEWAARRDPDPRSLPSEMRSLRRVVRSVEPDLVHLHSAKAGLVGRLLIRRRLPTLYMPHAWSWLAVDGLERQLALGWERLSARWTDVVCCVSEAEREVALSVGISANFIVLPNDVDAASLRSAAPPDRESARESLDVPTNVLLAVCTARLARQKGQDVLLDAWPAVRRRVPQAQLCLVGGGPDEKWLNTKAQSLDGVALIGAQPRQIALAWMKAADVVVCPSRYEGMSLVPVEAGFLGRVVVATDVEGMREAGFDRARVLVPKDDPSALGAAIAHILGDSEGRRAAENSTHTSAERLMTVQRSTERIVDVYRGLVRDA